MFPLNDNKYYFFLAIECSGLFRTMIFFFVSSFFTNVFKSTLRDFMSVDNQSILGSECKKMASWVTCQLYSRERNILYYNLFSDEQLGILVVENSGEILINFCKIIGIDYIYLLDFFSYRLLKNAGGNGLQPLFSSIIMCRSSFINKSPLKPVSVQNQMS